MKRAQIIKNGQVTNQAEMPEADLNAWIAKHQSMGSFGSEARQELSVGAVLDEQGVEISPAQYVTIPASYSIQITDITDAKAQEQINAESEAYLASTDWLIIREADDGTPCPQDIRTARAAARASIVR
jgi:hypothetical protein